MKNLKIKLIILFIMSFFFGHTIFAASLDLNTEKNNLQNDESFTVTVLLNTEGSSINALEGGLKYDENFLKAEAVNTGSSFVSFWVEKPDINTPGLIHFSGLTPGGISASKSEAFKVVFKTIKPGDIKLQLDKVSLLLDDGKGSILQSTTNNISLAISNNKNTTQGVNPFSFDKTTPEKFTIIRAKDASVFDNQWFTAFSTIDKESGIDHYQVCELFNCVISESPYLLRNQTPFYYVVVKAYDMNGNFTASTLYSSWFALLVLLIIILIIVVLVFINRRYTKTHTASLK